MQIAQTLANFSPGEADIYVKLWERKKRRKFRKTRGEVHEAQQKMELEKI